MAKSEKSPQLSLRPLQEEILTAALPRIARVLRPYPKGAQAADLEDALESLAKRGLIHRRGRSPNLTSKGVEAAKTLAKKA